MSTTTTTGTPLRAALARAQTAGSNPAPALKGASAPHRNTNPKEHDMTANTYRMELDLERGRRRYATAYSARCSFPGCESAARPNPADTENGPNAHDLDDVFCAYHEDELWLIDNLDERPAAASPTAWHRHEDEPCQRGTIGCSVDHLPEHPDGRCETW